MGSGCSEPGSDIYIIVEPKLLFIRIKMFHILITLT